MRARAPLAGAGAEEQVPEERAWAMGPSTLTAGGGGGGQDGSGLEETPDH